jgi:hypothetical protein
MNVGLISPPEEGQPVSVRSRHWVVNDVQASALAHSPLKPSAAPRQHLVTLTSIEDDALGEELQVFWELEPGARKLEKVDLPEASGFDKPDRLDAFLGAVRWGAASTADVKNIQAPFRAGIDIEDYQLDPVVRAIQMPRVNLLIADDVGLGKTIEAGVVALELILRHRARRVLVLCPPCPPPADSKAIAVKVAGVFHEAGGVSSSPTVAGLITGYCGSKTLVVNWS